MGFADIGIRILIGMGAVGAFIYFLLVIVMPIFVRTGRTVAPDAEEAFQLALGFCVWVGAAILVVAVWFTGDKIVGLLGM